MITIIVPENHPEAVSVPVSDRGLAYGDGLFETILVRNGEPQLLQAHCQRMLDGARRLGIPACETDLVKAVDRVRTGASRVLEHQVLKLVLTRGSGGRGYRPPSNPEPRLILSLTSAPPATPDTGVRTVISDIPLTVNPVFAGIKSLNRLEQVMASRAMPEDCYEALMPGDQEISGKVPARRCSISGRGSGAHRPVNRLPCAVSCWPISSGDLHGKVGKSRSLRFSRSSASGRNSADWCW